MGRFARYELLDRIGVGGMAEVWAARGHRSDGTVREVVVKRIAPELAGDEDFQGMLLEEARMTARLQHPNIVQTLDWGRLDDTLFLAMERVVGMDGRRLLDKSKSRQQPIAPPIALHIVACVLDALAHAHGERDERGDLLGIVHRDISPANVLLSTKGEVKLADFGIARARFRESRTMVGQVRGKPRYMSPEQARGETLDARSDVFAAGLLLYEFLTNEPAYEGGDSIEDVIDGLEAEVPLPSAVVPDLPPGIDALVQGMCEREREARYQTAADAREAIDGLVRRRGLALAPRSLAELVQSFAERTSVISPNVTAIFRVDELAGSVRLLAEPVAATQIGTVGFEDRTQVRRDTIAQEPPPDRTLVHREPSLENIGAPILETAGENDAAGTTMKNPKVRSRAAPTPVDEADEVRGSTVRSPKAGPSIPAPPWFLLPILVAILAVLAVVFGQRG